MIKESTNTVKVVSHLSPGYTFPGLASIVILVSCLLILLPPAIGKKTTVSLVQCKKCHDEKKGAGFRLNEMTGNS